MLTTFADDIANNSLYIEADFFPSLSSDVPITNDHSFSDLSFQDNHSFALTNDGFPSNDIDSLYDSNFDGSSTFSSSSFHLVDTSSSFNTQNSSLGQSSSFSELEPHNPLFGAHPLLIPFSQDSVNQSTSQLGDTTLFEDLQNDFIGSVAPSTSTPLKLPCSVLSNESTELSSLRPSQVLDPDSYNWITSSDGRLKVQCKECGVFINTGSHARNLGPIMGHTGGKTCLSMRSQHIANQQLEIRLASDARNALFHPNGSLTSMKGKENDAPVSLNLTNNAVITFEVVTPSKFRSADIATDSESDLDMDPIEHTTNAPFRQLENLPSIPNIDMSKTVSHMECFPSESADDCPGIPLNWPLARFWLSYPFSRHEGGRLGYGWCRTGNHGSDFWIRSSSCTRMHSIDGGACTGCKKLPKIVNHIVYVATHAAPGTGYGLLSNMQLQTVTRDKDQKLRTVKLDVLNLKRRCASLMSQQCDSRRFLEAVGNKHVPRLQQLVKQCVDEKVSVKEIINRIEDSVSKLYSVRAYEQIDYDMALLCCRLGGRSLLHSMSKRFTLPSMQSINRTQKFTRLVPSHGTPTEEEIAHNINEVLRPYNESLGHGCIELFSSGISILWDEINEEDVATYFPDSDLVGGLCREHSAGVDLRLKSLESALSIAKALGDATVHYGKEASVIAISSFGSKLAGALPIVISPTCKAETPKESGNILRRVIAVYRQHAAHTLGPIWSAASDGDAGRRLMSFTLFVKYEILREHVLYKFVGRLNGLNLFVGEEDITADIDWKHLLKRMARLLRTIEGLLIGNTLINRDIIFRYLRSNPDLNDFKVNQLMNPADAQDVPRAIELLESIANIPLSDWPSPTEQQEASVLHVIGQMFSAFLDAFTLVDWSLAEQLISLSKYAHMSFILFRQNRVNFMPNQLYIDTQTCIKNAIFCVAKQKQLDDRQPFYLFMTGDDCLENLFGRIRMQGGHNPNCSFKQLVDRAAAAVDISNIYVRNPELDPGHRRLKVTRTEHKDHLNSKSWRGCTIVSKVDLYDCWKEGQKAAMSALLNLGINEDLDILFEKPVTDLMRPFGDGHYPGIADSAGSDRSAIINITIPSAQQSISNNTCIATSANLQDAVSETTPDEQVGTDIQVYEDAYLLDDEELSVFTLPDSADDAETEESIGLDDLIEVPDELRLPVLSNTAEMKPSPWIHVDGKRIHKASLCRVVINPFYGRKSHERILRVCGYTSETKPGNLNSDNIISSDAFLVGDLYATLARCGNQACFALAKCVAIEQKGKRTDRVNGQDLQYAASKTVLYGQILDLCQVQDPKTNVNTDDNSAFTDAEEVRLTMEQQRNLIWIWSGSYVKLDLNARSKTLKGKSARKTLVVKCASHLCALINPRLLEVGSIVESDKISNSIKLTWELNDEEIDFTTEKLWQSVKNNNALNALPLFTQNLNFPYQNVEGEVSLICEEGSEILMSQAAPQSQKIRCYQCLVYVEPGQIRDHVGRHILKAMRQVQEELKGEPISGEYPCGFCGKTGITACSELYLTKGSSMQAKSNCIHFTKFRYQPALISTTTTPCTNVPILCTLPHCSKTTQEGYTAIWKYNMIMHIQAEHPGYIVDAAIGEYGRGTQLPDDLVAAMFISDEEEGRMKIPKENIPLKIAPKDNINVSTRGGTKRKASACGENTAPGASLRTKKKKSK